MCMKEHYHRESTNKFVTDNIIGIDPWGISQGKNIIKIRPEGFARGEIQTCRVCIFLREILRAYFYVFILEGIYKKCTVNTNLLVPKNQ